MGVTLASLEVLRVRATRVFDQDAEVSLVWNVTIFEGLFDPDEGHEAFGPGRPIITHLALNNGEVWGEIDISGVLTGSGEMSANDVAEMIDTTLLIEPAYDFGRAQLGSLLASLGTTGIFPAGSPVAEVQIISPTSDGTDESDDE